MKASEILTAAANLVDQDWTSSGAADEGWCCCPALNQVGMWFPSRDKAKEYLRLLAPNEDLAYQYVRWFGTPLKKANQNQRVLALLFAAAMAESEGN